MGRKKPWATFEGITDARAGYRFSSGRTTHYGVTQGNPAGSARKQAMALSKQMRKFGDKAYVRKSRHGNLWKVFTR